MLLEAEGISKSYHNGRQTLEVLKAVNLQAREGEIVAIVGPSGAGKSTLLHILGGLDAPQSGGRVVLQGDDIYRLNDQERAQLRNKKVGLVFQFYHLLPEFTAVENVLLPVMIKHKQASPEKFQALGEQLLIQVGLKERLRHKPYQLSGGEQQRVAIARALVNEPQIIFCDEPTGNLDSVNGQEVLELLISLNNKRNQTLVIVTHDEHIARKATRVIGMKDGSLIEN